MIPAVRIRTRYEMMVRITKFSELEGSLDGFADSHLPRCERGIVNVIGFQPPESDLRYVSPVGADALKNARVPIFEKYGLRALQTWLRFPLA